MDNRERKFHECIKRTLFFDNGKKIAPVCFCMTNNSGLDNMCYGSSESVMSSDPEYREVQNYVSGRSCIGCAFSRIKYYFSDAVRMLKSLGLSAMQKEMTTGCGYKDYIRSVILNNLLFPLFDKVKARCYLTVSDSDYKYFRNKVGDYSYNDLVKLVVELDKFCDENGIK